MPFERITASEFESLIRQAILRRDEEQDVAEGEIADVVISPPADVFERVHDRIAKLSNIITLARPSEFSGEYSLDLEGIVFNERITRSAGSQASGTVTFSTATQPSSDIVVQRGFPIGTLPSESTGAVITFVTTEARTLPAASAVSFKNQTTGRFELQIPVVAVSTGPVGRVAAGRVTRNLRPMAGFDDITNVSATVGGRGRESNEDLIRRYFLSVVGRRLTTQQGLLKSVLDLFPDVEDALPVFGDDPLLTRGGDDAGAVDCYILGEESTTVSENIEYLGPNTLLQVSLPPLLSVVSVTELATGANFDVFDATATPVGSYEVVQDTGSSSESTRAADGIKFISGGTAQPLVGNLVTVTYTYNNLIRRLQATFEQDDLLVHGRDVLFREAERVEQAHVARLTVGTGFNAETVEDAVRRGVLNFYNTLRLGNDVEGSDIQAVVRAIAGVDNYVITRLTKLSDPTGTSDVLIDKNQYARLDDANYILS